MSVFMGTARILRVVQVQCSQSVQADHPVKLGQHPIQILCQRVPAIAHMTGVQAHADLVLQLHTVYNAAQLLKGAAHLAALTGHRLQQYGGMLLRGQQVVQRPGDIGNPVIRPLPHVGTGVKVIQRTG